MKKSVKLLSLLTVICMLLSSCGQSAGEVADNIVDNTQKGSAAENDVPGTESTESTESTENTGNANAEQPSATPKNEAIPEKGTYKEGVALVKYDGEMNDNVLSQLDLVSATALYSGSSWYTVELKAGADTAETVNYLRELDCFEKVDYDYIMNTGADTSSVDVSGNPDYDKHDHHKTHKIPEGWEEVKKNGKHPGGSPDVIVAVIDTGVDYNHLDLRNNIWVNPAEIPNNGKDDDGNGYIDDVYGWDCVGNDKDPMDDNGHGTHVAGIIAAENNKIGGVGVAYNCKVMVLKAGNSSGYFNNSDIAEAIQYAYMNGASVINMSFGGSNISIAVEEALENAYNSCVLVAAAGNDALCNNLTCQKHKGQTGVSYPAALPYVIGVMSTNGNGSAISGFSNFDHYPHNSVEYEVFAVGEAVPSCWPGNKYATLNGTSMAAPTVAGIAALLRSYYTDREVYSTKFIQSQIVNTGTVNPYNILLKETDDAHSVADVQEALTKLPKPAVNLYDYYIDDSVSISSNNNGNGVIDAGETVRLYISLHNRGGIASDVNVSIDTDRGMGMTDPYFTFVNSTMQLSDIGTYSVRESGDKYFEIVVDANCPNDYLVNFNIRFTYTNGLDAEDKTVYEDDGRQQAQFNVSRGFYLPATITEDTVYKADRLYIVGEEVLIPEGVTVTFEEGCEIQFYDDREYYQSPSIIVYGVLNIAGTADNMVKMYPSERHSTFAYGIVVNGNLEINYADVINAVIGYGMNNSTASAHVNNSYLRTCSESTYVYDRGRAREPALDMTHYFGCSDSTYGEVNYYNNYIESTAFSSRHSTNFNNNVFFIKDGSFGYECKNFENNIVFSCGVSSDIEISNEGKNNRFVALEDARNIVPIKISTPSKINGNEFSPLYQEHASKAIEGYYDSTGTPTIDVYGSCLDISKLWSYVVSVEMFDKDGNSITTVGREEIKVRVTFNRPMDKDAGTFLTFGTIEPYADYRIDGEYVSDTVWEGTYTLKAQIENGQNFLKVNNAWAAEDPTKTVFGEYQLHEFTIDTTVAMSMNLQAVAKENGIELTFAQDDYDTLLGYNIYRADSKDGNYVKLNPAILLPSDSTFLDENAEPGKTYWYTYTVVLTDFTESNPAGKVQATAMDTLAPNMYHTPVNQGYMNNNLVISCTASDNVAISNVTLYYRAVGATEWKSLGMAKQSDKYSATIFGSELTLDGIEYYIVATDGLNDIAKGSAETPYTVIVKDSSAISRKGDVDGDGVVTTKDALMLMQCINGDLILSDDEFKRADLNGDNVLNSSEALRILQYINGKVNTLEM